MWCTMFEACERPYEEGHWSLLFVPLLVGKQGTVEMLDQKQEASWLIFYQVTKSIKGHHQIEISDGFHM